MTMLLRPRETFAATIAQRRGFVSVHDKDLPLNTPHYHDGKDLDKVLKAMDHRLEVGYIMENDPRQNRWAVLRYTDDGGQQLVRIVQTEDHAYQKPDQRVFLDLQKHRLGGVNGRMWIEDALTQEERIEAAKAKAKEEDMAEFRDTIAKHVRDNRFKGKQGQTVF